MAYAWPSGTKALTTTTDQASDRIDQARTDINQNITNVNQIIDMFDLASEPTNGQILKYNTTNDRFEVGADAGGIALTDLSVGAEGTASGDGALSYDNTTGVFTYTPPVLSGLTGDTDDIAEGSTNLYYTTGRFDTAFSGKTTTDLSEGTNLYYTDARARASISVGAELTASGDGAVSYTSGTGVLQYTPPTLAGINGSIGDLTDVDLTGNANEKILKYNSTSGNFEVADAAGSTQGKHDIWIPVSAMIANATTGPAVATTNATTTPDVLTYDFDQSTNEYAQFSIAMPKSWNESSNIGFSVYWTATTGSGDVRWNMRAVAMGDGDILTGAFGTAYVVIDTYNGTANDLHINGPTDIIIAGTPADLDIVYFQIYRDAAHVNDTLTADAKLLGVKLTFTTNEDTDD